MRKVFASYDDYRKVVDELVEQLQVEQKIINWKKYHSIYQDISTYALNIRRYKEFRDLYLNMTEEQVWILDDVDLFCNIRELYIQTSGLSELPKSIFNLKELRYLKILPYEQKPNYKKIYGIMKVLPENIDDLSNLKSLYIEGQKLEFLPERIQFLESLVFLSFKKNNITNIPDWIGDLSSLEILDISDNPITNLPKSIAKLPKLKSLYATNCQLTSIPKEIEELKSVTIRLGGNPLPLAKKLNYGLKELNEWK